MTGSAGSSQQSFGGAVNFGSNGQIHVFLNLDRKQSTEYWAKRSAIWRPSIAPGARPSSIPATGIGGGNSPADRLPRAIARRQARTRTPRRCSRRLRTRPGTAHVTSSIEQLAPQVDVIFDRDRARVLDIDIATVANAIRSSYGGSLVTQFETPKGVEYVQVTYPTLGAGQRERRLRIPVRARNGSLLHVGDVAQLVQNPVEPRDDAHQSPDGHPCQPQRRTRRDALDRAERVPEALGRAGSP